LETVWVTSTMLTKKRVAVLKEILPERRAGGDESITIG